ncbi:hypothetical protein AAZX31_14G142400 [Glycine max]|nr:hypothetical protein JHK87_040030 [Glycine soja]KAG4963350.1 hypothetical protein JHK86_040218 [Glycine max]
MAGQSPLLVTKTPFPLIGFGVNYFSYRVLQLTNPHLTIHKHPQTDGQNEVANKCLETYLHCMCFRKPTRWSKWLSLAKWWYNTNFHSSIQTTPYEVVYDQAPPIQLPFMPGEVANPTVDRTLSKREQVIQLLKFHLTRAQN